MSNDANLREYIVTLHQFDDLESFYADMETEGGNLYIPIRAVDCHVRRPISSNTHYLLTEQEAEQIRQDPRVRAVNLTPEEEGIELKPLWTQTSTRWNKSKGYVPVLQTGQLNWGLLRVTEGQQRPNWGEGLGGVTEVSGTVTVPFSGKNVDVVMLDGRLEIEHPEFAKNVNGTGGSRVQQFNWFSLNSTVVGPSEPAGTYLYTPTDPNSDYHGTLCASIVAGTTQGWAKDANIYSIYAYAYKNYADRTQDSQFVPPALQWDYIRAWHNAKAINPATGKKNPTIVNASIGYADVYKLSQVTSITYRGTTYPKPPSRSFTIAEAQGYGLVAYVDTDSVTNLPTDYVQYPFRRTFMDSDVEACIAAGIIVVCAAGNESSKAVLPNTVDYNNQLSTDDGFSEFYSQGSTPGAATGSICVGAVGEALNPAGEEKATYSNCGPRVDIFAPGSSIRGAVNNNFRYSILTVPDTRNSNFKIYSASGTSFASPQIAGVLATLLEVTPYTFTQADALSYIVGNAKSNQMYDSNNSLDFKALEGAPNRYAFASYPATISITPSATTATPSQIVDYTINIPGVPNGSLVYLTDSGTSTSSDFVDGVRQFVLTVNGGTASLSRTVSAVITGTRTSILQLRTGGYDGNIQSTASAVTVSAGDFANSSGSFTINAQGIGSFFITPSIDGVIEGNETFTVSIRTGSISGNVVKTSDTITINDA